MTMRRKPKAKGAARSNGHALTVVDDPQRQAYERARAVHQRSLPDLLPYYEKAVAAIADAVRIDELKPILDDTEKLLACARILENREAEINLAEIRGKAWRRLGEISRGLKKRSGPGRGKKTFSTGGKSFALAAAKISTTSAHRAELFAAIPEGEFNHYYAQCREQGRPGRPDDLMRRQRLGGGIKVRPYNKNDFFRRRHTVLGDQDDSGRIYAETQAFSTLDRVIHVVHVMTDLPDRVRGWVTRLSDGDQLHDFLQRLSELPPAKWQRYFDDQLEEHDQGVVNFVEVTTEAHEAEQPQRQRKERKFNSTRRRGRGNGAAHQTDAR
jgi:hypothetical protein